MTRITLFIFSFIFIGMVQGQITKDENVVGDDEYEGIEASINIGSYFGNNNTANFYNGAGNEDGMNSADRIINNTYILNDINEVLEQNGYRYPLEEGLYTTEYPTNMKYRPAIYAGLTGRYWLNRKFGISISMNYSKLLSNDNFVIYNTNPDIPPSNKENQYVIGNIAGEEDRVNIDLGIINSFYLSDKMRFILETGFNLNNTSVVLNKIEIYGLVLDIKYKGPNDYIPGGNTQQYAFRQGGIGYGAYMNPGLQFNFTESISIDLVSQFYYTYISLEHYSNWGFQWAPFIRFNFTRLF